MASVLIKKRIFFFNFSTGPIDCTSCTNRLWVLWSIHTARQEQRFFCHNGAKVFTLCSSGSGKVACNVMQNILPLPFCHWRSHTEWGWNLFICGAIATAAATATATQFEQVHLMLLNPIVTTGKCCRCHSRCRTVWTDLYHRLWLSTFFYRAGNGLQYPWTGLTLQFLLQSEKCDSLAWPRYR